jgi:hypothetical protein
MHTLCVTNFPISLAAQHWRITILSLLATLQTKKWLILKQTVVTPNLKKLKLNWRAKALNQKLLMLCSNRQRCARDQT